MNPHNIPGDATIESDAQLLMYLGIHPDSVFAGLVAQIPTMTDIDKARFMNAYPELVIPALIWETNGPGLTVDQMTEEATTLATGLGVTLRDGV